MPLEPYVNPTRKAPTGSYTWVPKNFNSTSRPNWRHITISRGRFRNDYYVSDSNKTINITDSSNQDVLKKYLPINNAFRNKQTPGIFVNFNYDDEYFVEGDDFYYQIEFPQSIAISAIKLIYRLYVDVLNKDLITQILASDVSTKEEDAAKVRNYQANPSGSTMDVDWNKYSFVKVTTHDNLNSDDQGTTQPPSSFEPELQTTSFFKDSTEFNDNSRTTTIRFAAYRNPEEVSNFSKILRIKISNQTGIKFKLYIKKIMIFNAAICNIDDDLLPCRLLSYVVPIKIDTTPENLARNSIFPNNLSFPTFELKVFVSDDVVNTRGFAHAVYLRFLFGSFPQYNASGSSIIEAINNASQPGYYVVIFAGITLGKETVIFYLSSEVISGISGRVVIIDTTTIALSTDEILLEKIISSSQPSDLDPWQEYLKFSIDGNNTLDNQIYPYVFYDESANARTWYRVVQIDSVAGKNITGNAFQGQTYIEKSVLSYDLTGTRSIPASTILRYYGSPTENILNLKPFALFELNSFDDKFGSNVSFRSGIIKFHFQARSVDPTISTNNHIFLRMWFMPGNETLDSEDPHKFRTSESEMIIKEYVTADGIANKIVIGSPTNIEDLIISPPLAATFTDYDVIRYTNGLKDSQNKDILYNSVYSSDPTLKVAVGLYVLSYPTSANSEQQINPIKPPTIELVLDPASTRVETTIVKNSKDILKPSKYFEFQSRTYTAESTDLFLSNKFYNGKTFDGQFKQYNLSFTVPLNATQESYENLLTLTSSDSSTDASFCIKFDDYSLQNDKSKYNWADLVTQGTYFTNAKINEGTWNIEILLDVDEDTIRIPYAIRILGFFIDFTGKVNERLFATPFIEPDFETLNSGEYSLKYSHKINYPFFIGGEKSQFILRIILYPYSSNGQRLRDDEEAALKNALKEKTQGGRIKKVIIDRTNNSVLKLNEGSDDIINDKFYENLPLTPNTSLDANEFWFVVDDEFTKTTIIEPGKGINLFGALYSPTWFLDAILPKGTECVVKKKGLLNQAAYAGSAIMFRTVLAPEDFEREEEKTTAVPILNKNSNSNSTTKPQGYIIASNAKKTDLPVSIASIDGSIYQLPLDDPLDNTKTRKVIAGYPSLNDFQNNLLTGSKGTNPSIANSDNGIIVIANQSKTESNSALGLRNDSGGLPNSWRNVNSVDLKVRNFNSLDFQISTNLNFVTLSSSPLDDSIYLCGLIQGSVLGSSIAVKKVDPKSGYYSQQQNFEATQLNITVGFTYVLDGGSDANSTTLIYDSKESLIISNYLSGRAIIDSHNGICINNEGAIYLSYVHVGDENRLKGLVLNKRYDIRPTIYTLVDMTLFSTVLASDKQYLNIYGSTLYYYQPTNNIYCAFWCAGKIFVFEVSNAIGDGLAVANYIILVAGNRNLSDDASNKAHKYMRNLKNNNILIVNDEYQENDIPSQSPGFFVDNGINNLGGLFIYYKLISGELVARKISPGGYAGPAIKVSD